MQPERRAKRPRDGSPGSRRAVVAMAWPLAVGMLSFTVMGVADTLLIGHVSTEAQAGVGMSTVILFVLTAFFRGLLSGAQSVVAAADGAKDRGRLERAAGAGVLLGLLTGVLASLALLGVRAWLLPVLLDDPLVRSHAEAFLGMGVLIPALSLVAQGLLSGLQGLGDTRSRMWASLLGNLVNIGLDLVLIFGLGPIEPMGASGAALATVLGSLVMVVVYALRYRTLFGRVTWPDRAVVRDAIALGLPAGSQQFFMSAAFLITTSIIAQAGAVHLAANQVLIQVLSVSFLPGFGIGEASGILVGRALGAGDRALANRTLRSGRTVALAVMGACGVFFAFGGGWLGSLFNPDPAVQALVAQLLRIAAVFQLFDAVAMVHICVLRAAGDNRFSLLITTGCAWGITLPMAWLLGHQLGLGAVGAWLGVSVEIITLAALSTWRVRGIATGHVGRMDLLLGRKAVA